MLSSLKYAMQREVYKKYKIFIAGGTRNDGIVTATLNEVLDLYLPPVISRVPPNINGRIQVLVK